jgi:hypothetical protein
MTRYGFLNRRNNVVFKLLFMLSLIFHVPALYAQSPINFSGIWTKDNVKSDDFYKDFNIKCTITQTPQSFTIRQTFFDKSGKEITTSESSFNLDGKETSKEEQGYIDKVSAKWSPDKKSLVTTSTRTVGKDVYGSSASYSLSDNGLVLTVLTSDINPGGLSVTQILNKEK